MNRESNNSGVALFWGVVAVGAISVGMLVAILAGYLLGHYTHTRTKTVAVRTVTVAATGSTSPSTVAPTTTAASTPAPAPATTPKKTAPALKASSTLAVAADPAGGLKYTTDKLTAKAGNVTIDFTNKSPVPHDVVIAKGSAKLGQTKTITASEDKSVVVKLTPGTYVYYCSLPGHRGAGMEGTLTVR